MKMRFFYLFFMVFIVACSNMGNTPAEGSRNDYLDHQQIIRERIDGPANVQSNPGGEILFTLDDNIPVEISLAKNGWHQILVYAEVDSTEFDMDSIKAGRDIIIDGKKSGKVLKTHRVGISRSKQTWAMLYGYIHKNSIRRETVIETWLLEKLRKSGRGLKDWQDFIYWFDLQTDSVQFAPFTGYYNYENGVDDPSPGFRVMLLFEGEKLQGVLHSRSLPLDDMSTRWTDRGLKVSFYKDYPVDKQEKFMEELENWLLTVD